MTDALTDGAVDVPTIPFRYARVASGCVGLVSCLVLVGWLFDINVLKSVVPGLVAMNPLTALTLVFASASLWLVHSGGMGGRDSFGFGWVTRIGAGLVVVVGTMTLAGYAVDRNFGLDQLLFSDQLAGNRVAPNTGFNMLLVGVALLLLTGRIKRGYFIAQILAVVSAFVALFAIVGYLYDVTSLSGLASYIPMALNTAVAFIVLDVGIVAAQPGIGLAALVRSKTAGGMVFRWFLPAAIAIPIVLGWLRLEGQRSGLYGTEFGTAVVAVANSAIFAALVLGLASVLNRVEAERRSAADVRARLAAIVDSSEDAIIGKTLDGEITSWNPGAARLYGYAAAEMVGQPIALLVPPGNEDEVPAILDRVARGERIEHYETQRRTKDGYTIDVALTVSPIRDATGVILGASAIARDVTDRKRAEAAIARQARLLDLTHDTVIVRDLAGTITFWNRGAEATYGWTREEALGQVSFALLRTQFPQPLDEIEAELLRVGRWEGELIHSTRDGLSITASSRWTLERDADDNPLAVLEINHDVTKRRAAEVALETANRELEAFSYSVSHDLRAPLRATHGFAQILVEDYAAEMPEEARRYLHLVQDSARRMGQLIDDLLTFSRLSRQPLVTQAISPHAIVRQVLDEVAPELEGRSVEIMLNDLPDCEADAALLRQVYANLLSNALKYTRARETAIIEVGSEAGESGSEEHIYYVRDNGTGFDMAYAHKLFSVFQRLHRAEDYEGTGVGLAIVQRIVHRHGGRVWAEAKPDHGATFWFTLRTARTTALEAEAAGAVAA